MADAPPPKRSKFSDAPPPQEPDDLVSSFLKEIAEKPAPPKPPPPPTNMKPPPKIYFDVLRGEGDDEGELLGRLDLSGASQLTFGRDATRVDVPLEHGSVSRHHATITFDADVAYISDIKSTHGTYVTTPDGGEEKISTLTRLDEGSTVRFGESSRRYVLRRSAQGTTRQVQQQQPVVQEVTVILQVPSATSGRLTGQKGRALEQVRYRTGATMRVLPPPAEDRDDGSAGRRDQGSGGCRRGRALGVAGHHAVSGHPGSIGRGRPALPSAASTVVRRAGTTMICAMGASSSGKHLRSFTVTRDGVAVLVSARWRAMLALTPSTPCRTPASPA